VVGATAAAPCKVPDAHHAAFDHRHSTLFIEYPHSTIRLGYLIIFDHRILLSLASFDVMVMDFTFLRLGYAE